MSHVSRRVAPKPSDEFHAYLRSLQTRAADISQTMAKLQLRERAPHWPRLLSQFAVLCSQLQTLYDELLTSERSWSSRLHSSMTLCQPMTHTYNPATTLRIKPTVEADEFEATAYAEFRKDADLSEYSILELRDQLNDYNTQVLKLGRFATLAASLPLPRDPPAAAAAAAAATTSTATTTGAAPPPSRMSKADIDRIEEAELQKTLAAMMTGKQTKLLPSQQQPPAPQSSHPPTASAAQTHQQHHPPVSLQQ